MRLKRIYQDYKSNYFLDNKRGIVNTYDLIVRKDRAKCDYNESSFSYYHWSLIDQLYTGKINIADLENPTIEHLVYVILPGGNSIFHLLASL